MEKKLEVYYRKKKQEEDKENELKAKREEEEKLCKELYRMYVTGYQAKVKKLYDLLIRLSLLLSIIIIIILIFLCFSRQEERKVVLQDDHTYLIPSINPIWIDLINYVKNKMTNS